MPLMGLSELNSLVYSLYIVPYTTVFVVSLLVFRKAIKKKLVMLPFKGGMYIFNLMDYQTAGLSLLFISLMEVISIGWIYGECRIIDQTKRLNKVITIIIIHCTHYLYSHWLRAYS